MYSTLCTLLLLLSALSVRGQSTAATYRQEVVAHSRELLSARAHSEGAAEALLLSRTELLPRLTLSGDLSYALRQSEGVKPWGFGLRPEISATLYEGGRLRGQYREASLSYAIAREEEVNTELLIRYAADYAYWDLSARGEFLAAMRRYVEIIRSLKAIIESRFREGYIAKGDVLMVEARLSTAEYELLVASQNFEEALHNFNILRGTPSDQAVELAESIFDSLPLPKRISLGATLDARPDFRAASLRQELSQNAIGLARSDYNPKLSLGVEGVWRPESPNRSGKTLLDGALVARLSVPIFGWGARRHAVQRARAVALESRWQQESLREEILREERNGWSVVVESHAQVAAVRESLRIAGENLELGTYSYGEGLTTILDVLQAQLNWIQIYTNAITAQFNYAVARSAYERISGGVSSSLAR